MWSNRFCLLSQMRSRPPRNVAFYQIPKPPRGQISPFWRRGRPQRAVSCTWRPGGGAFGPVADGVGQNQH